MGVELGPSIPRKPSEMSAIESVYLLLILVMCVCILPQGDTKYINVCNETCNESVAVKSILLPSFYSFANSSTESHFQK
jgi:hypothetical protein